MRWYGTSDEILHKVKIAAPEIDDVLRRVREIVPTYKREISIYQAAALYVLARRYGTPGAHILEIGTAWGYSAAVMALAAPQASIVTLNPKHGEMETAQSHLKVLDNVTVLKVTSEDYLSTAQETEWDMIFDDGDHQHVAANLPYYDTLRHNGLLLWHDYSPADSWRPCPPVYEVVTMVCAALGKDTPDITIIDDGGVGMAGIHRQTGHSWKQWNIARDYAPWKVEYPARKWVKS